MCPVPEKGRDATREGRANDPAREGTFRLAGRGSVNGPSHAVAKYISLPATLQPVRWCGLLTANPSVTVPASFLRSCLRSPCDSLVRSLRTVLRLPPAVDISCGRAEVCDRRPEERAVFEARQSARPLRQAGRPPGTKEAREVRPEGFRRVAGGCYV